LFGVAAPEDVVAVYHSLSVVLPEALPVLVAGDLMLDEIMRGVVHRISPEAPVPVLEWSHSTQTLGGAGNVAANLAQLGAAPRVCGVVGDDAAGRTLRALLQERHCDMQGVVTAPSRPTTHKLRVVSQVQHMLRVDREVRSELADAMAQQASALLQAQLPLVRGVICSDYQKGFLTPRLLRRTIAAAKAAGLAVLIDPKGRDYTLYQGATVLTPNLHELELASGLPIRSPQELDTAAWQLMQRLEVEAILVTCGKDGMVLFREDGSRVRIAAQAREVFDVTGAGDTVIAVFGMAYFAGATMQEAARLANIAAGLVVGKQGTATLERAELAQACADRQGGRTGKVATVSEVMQTLDNARLRGERIVMTNGCFDLLHAGHVRYLQAAKALGERLVVGINTDRSVRQLKGAKRPLVAEHNRAEVLAALACVDHVVLFDEATPKALVEALQPDILVKGSDYEGRQVVGRETVEARGGRVELVPIVQGASTTNLVDTIVARHAKTFEPRA
jgi:D-beta-D-heptose 7-phosphate kinase/D-beta-D-heptose 1-phosphate adenosyltransferase